MKKRLLIILAALTVFCGCDPYDFTPHFATDNVFVYYNGGYNNLTPYFETNFESMDQGYVPDEKSHDIILLFTHHTRSSGDYSTPTEPVLARLYMRGDKIVRDTLVRYDASVSDIDARTVNMVLNDVARLYPGGHYGMLFSSHATGWMPPSDAARHHEPFVAQQSIGARFYGDSSDLDEMDVRDFAAAIPMKLDYLILDCCFGGAVEVAYQLKDKCRKFVASPTEILGYGMDYKRLSSRVFAPEGPDMRAVCEDFAEVSSSYTVGLVDCARLDNLAAAVNTIVSNHRVELKSVDRNSVQRYFRYSEHGYFWDLRHILVKAGASATELNLLDDAISQAVLFEDHSDNFLGLKIDTSCGLSMYIPYDKDMNGYYRDLAWNKVTGLVE